MEWTHNANACGICDAYHGNTHAVDHAPWPCAICDAHFDHLPAAERNAYYNYDANADAGDCANDRDHDQRGTGPV